MFVYLPLNEQTTVLNNNNNNIHVVTYNVDRFYNLRL